MVSPTPPSGPSPTRLWSRRSVIAGIGVVAAGAATPGVLRLASGQAAPSPSDAPVSPSGRHARCTIYRADDDFMAEAGDAASLGEVLTRITDGLPTGQGSGEGAHCLDQVGMMIGLGPRLVAAVDPSLPGAIDLPRFRDDDAIPAHLHGGDIVVLMESHDLGVVSEAAGLVESTVTGLSPSWFASGYRKGGRMRNAFGFHDEVVMPRTPVEIQQHVVIPDGPAAGGTICTLRLLDLDVAGFSSLPVGDQEAAVGRHRDSGAPLSGSSIDDPIDLQARHPDGRFVVPERSHVRAAHPLFTGSSLMLRRSYNVTATSIGGPNGDRERRQMLFISYQRDVETFVSTQRRLDTADDLMDFAAPVASATFLMLPLSDGPAIEAMLTPAACAS